MKKILFVIISCAVLASSLFAKSSSTVRLLGDIEKLANSMDKTAIKGVEGVIPEDKTLRGAVNLLLDIKPDEGDKKINVIQPNLESVDLLNDVYEIRLKVIYKLAIGHACESSYAVISKTENGFSVIIKEYNTYACKADGSVVGDIRDMSAKYFDKLAKWYVDSIIELCEKTSADDFTAADSQMLTYLRAYCEVSETAANKLKAKKWYNEHSIEGLPISGKYYFWGIDESKVPGFAYELNFAFTDKNLKAHFFSVLSNNDEYIDLKEDTGVMINGVIRSVSFSDFGNDYKVSDIVIEER